MPPNDVMRWEMATDENFTDVVQSGTEIAAAYQAHSVHVSPYGLSQPGTTGTASRLATRSAPSDAPKPRLLRAPFERYVVCLPRVRITRRATSRPTGPSPKKRISTSSFTSATTSRVRARSRLDAGGPDAHPKISRPTATRTQSRSSTGVASSPRYASLEVIPDDHEVYNNFEGPAGQSRQAAAAPGLLGAHALKALRRPHLRRRRADLTLYRYIEYGDLARFVARHPPVPWEPPTPRPKATPKKKTPSTPTLGTRCSATSRNTGCTTPSTPPGRAGM